MKICIIGSGNIGQTLARRLKGANFDVMFGSRNPESEKNQNISKQIGIKYYPLYEGFRIADVSIIAAPSKSVFEISDAIGNSPKDIIIDVMNSFGMELGEYRTSADVIRAKTGCYVAKCFNSTGVENMANPNYNGTKADMFIAGDPQAKEVAAHLADAIGFFPYDLGGPENFDLTESLARFWIQLSVHNEQINRNHAIKVITR